MMLKEKLRAEHVQILAGYGLGWIDTTETFLLRYKSNEYILQQEYACPYVLIVLKGTMKVFVSAPNGRTLLICYYSSSGIIGEVEFATDRDTAASSVQAITEVSCIGIPRVRFQNELKSNITFMNAVSVALAQKLFRSNKNSAVTILHALDARLCAYIAMTNKNGYFKEKLTETAEILGTSYRHLLRTLENLCRRGVLEKTSQGFLISHEAALKRISDDYYLK